MAAVRPAARERHAAPSFAQERLFAEEHLFQTEAVYTVASGVRLRGQLDATALRAALSALADRHELLRGCFRTVAGRPTLVISTPGPMPELVHEDLRGHPVEGRRALAWQRLTEAQRRPFDLEHAPLWRALLLTLAADEHWLLLTLHHAIVDGWAMDTVWGELAVGYQAAIAGEAPAFPPLQATYTDYAARQRAALGGARLDQLLTYWRDQLAGQPADLALPLDRPRSAVPRYAGAGYTFTVPRHLVSAARTLASRNRTTLFVVMLAVFARLLSRYCGTEDVTVGVPMANRDRPETRDLVGLLVNPLPLRLRMEPEGGVDELVSLARQVTLGAMVHQDLPFDRLVREFAVHRDTGAHPLFQVLFSVQTVPERQAAFAGLEVSALEQPDGPAAGMDLSMLLQETGADLVGFIEYRSDLWEAATIARLGEHFVNLLACAVVPGARLSDLAVSGPAEYRRLVDELPAGDSPAPAELMHRMVERVANLRPDAVAVTDGTDGLTYAELDRGANAVAALLRQRGVGPEALVAVCLPRGPALVTAWLGVLKAGGAYVPLDPTFPPVRIQQLVREAGVRVVLTDTELRDRLDLDAALLCCLDELAGLPTERPEVRVHPDNLAYVTFTSGSTGRPKGVMITHRALSNFAAAAVPLTESDVVGLHTSPSFDVSGHEVWSALAAGARIRTAASKDRLDPADYRELARAVSVLALTPGLFAALIDQDPATLARVPRLDLAGDRLDGDRVRRHRDRPGLVTLNCYGPTECTVYATAGTATRLSPSGRVPIGRPLPGIRAYVLDADLHPVPVGVVGELHLGGVGLARGYLNAPALTAERFVPNPYAAGQRLYRTGDLVRWLADGTLEFLGRNDDQVKVRGFRVEPGEVEAALREHHRVADAVVLARREPPGETRLVAYVVPTGPVDHAEVLDYLRARLPGHLVPAAVITLDRVPLTAAGKVDRARLPALAAPPTVAARAELTPTESAVASAWRDVLAVEEIGLDENFFEAGGDSLLALRAVGLLESRGVRISVIDLYRRATVRSCAAHIERVREDDHE